MCRESSMARHQKRWVAPKSTVGLAIPFGSLLLAKVEMCFRPEPKAN
jgi:hypothetical protein